MFKLNFLNDFFLSLINDPRDLIMCHLILNIVVIVFPLAISLFFIKSHLYGIACILTIWLLFAARFFLLLHYSEHRPLFKNNLLNLFVPFVLPPFFGLPTGMYYLHHIVMHHGEKNSEGFDASSTEDFQRDNFLHFLKYYFKWWLTTHFTLLKMSLRKKLVKEFITSFTLNASHLAIACYVYQYNSFAATYIFIVPFALASFVLAFGNFSQHIFLHPEKHGSSYGMTYNCINAFDNTFTFNDGYHVVHHVNPKLHWSEMPKAFYSNIKKYQKEDALVFENIGFFEIGILTMTHQYERLSKYYVNLKEEKKSTEEIVKLLKSRTRPIKFDKGL